ncbi:MAG: DUF948 domain-containing protein [Thermodesulfobacteriota bacterium]
MTVSDFFLGILALSGLALAIAAVPAFLRLGRAAGAVERLASRLSQDLLPLGQRLASLDHEIHDLAGRCRQGLDKTDQLLGRATATADRLERTSAVLLNALAAVAPQVGGLVAGWRAFAAALRRGKDR